MHIVLCVCVCMYARVCHAQFKEHQQWKKSCVKMWKILISRLCGIMCCVIFSIRHPFLSEKNSRICSALCSCCSQKIRIPWTNLIASSHVWIGRGDVRCWCTCSFQSSRSWDFFSSLKCMFSQSSSPLAWIFFTLFLLRTQRLWRKFWMTLV